MDLDVCGGRENLKEIRELGNANSDLNVLYEKNQ